MRRPSFSLVKNFAFCFVCLSLLTLSVIAADIPTDPRERFNLQHQAGIRLGVWNNLGGTPLASDTSGGNLYQTDLKSANFYFEAYFGYRLNPHLMFELSFGIVNRGDVTIYDATGNQFIGNLLVYPLQLRAKLYPLASLSPKFEPYLMAGGGLYYGRNSIQFTTSSSFFSNYIGDSRTDFNYMLAAGFDWPLSQIVGLDANVAYMPINFSNNLIFIRNYDAVTVTVGIKYLVPLRKK